MPELFTPFFLCVGAWIAFAVASSPGEYGTKTSLQHGYGIAAMMCFVAACTLGGALLATYVPPAAFR